MCAVSGQTFDWHGRGAEVLRRCVSPSYVLRAVRVHFSTRNSTDLELELDRSRAGTGPISARNSTDLELELDRSRRGTGPISTRNSTDLGAVLTCAARASAMIVTTAR